MRSAFVGDKGSNTRELNGLSKRKSKLLEALARAPLARRNYIETQLRKVSAKIARVCQKLDVIARHS